MPLGVNEYVGFLGMQSSFIHEWSVNRTSTDEWETRTNLTNLAMKGIIGIRAMSEICRILGKDDAQHFAVRLIAAEYPAHP